MTKVTIQQASVCYVLWLDRHGIAKSVDQGVYFQPGSTTCMVD
jgi:hypothetical protein